MSYNKLSIQYLISRLLILCNIIFTLFLVILTIVLSSHLLKLELPSHIKNIIPTMVWIIGIIGFLLIIANIVMYVINIIYNSTQYFKILEKLDFNDIHTSINLLNNIKSVDNIGYLGESIAKLLGVYINYATIYKKRLNFEQAKIKVLIETIEKGAILIKKMYGGKENYHIHTINKKALSLLNLENAGQAIEQSLISFIHTSDQKQYIDTILGLNLSPLESKGKLNEVVPEKLQLRFIVDHSSKEAEKNNFALIDTSITPFCLQFYDDYQHKNPENQNIVLDSYLILLSPTIKTSSYFTSETKE